MAAVTKINRRVALFTGEEGAEIGVGTKLKKDTWYFVEGKGDGSPFDKIPVKRFFKSTSQDDANQPALVAGDKLVPITTKRLCKTDANIAMTEAETEVQDDCMPVITRTLVGVADLSGTISGFMKYHSETGKLLDFSGELVRRWFDRVEDPGTGTWKFEQRKNDPQILLFCWNSDAKIDGVQNWLVLYANLNSTTFGGENSAVQMREVGITASDKGAPTFVQITIKDAKQEINEYE